MVPASALISRWFNGRLSTAIGLAYAGFGCGSLLLVPLAQALIDDRGWRDAYRAIGATLLILLPLMLLLPWRTIWAERAPRHRAPARARARDSGGARRGLRARARPPSARCARRCGTGRSGRCCR